MSARHPARRAFVFAAAVPLLQVALVFAQQTPPPAAPPSAPAAHVHEHRKWEHESSDLAVDPRIHFGAFESGMRFAWMDNAEPKQRLYLRLHVDAGSLSESDSELGMAHFLEHMAFNGSKNFPPGTLVEWLQKKGLGFGGDTNAMTDFGQTIYQLDLPTSDEAMLADGLKVMHDVCDGLLLADKEVNDEKGVIDGEERERDSAQWRVGRKTIELLFAGSRIPQRIPIGLKSERDHFDGKSIRAFYDRCYRPENCTLILVGDLHGRDPTQQIAESFGGWGAPATPLVPEPARGAAKLDTKIWCIHDAEIPTAQITVAMMKPWENKADDKAHRLKDLALDYARTMVNLRYSERVKKGDAPFLTAQEGEGGGFDVLDGEELTFICEPMKWKEALAAVQTEMRAVLLHGFTQGELDEVRKNALRALDEAVESEKTRQSERYVSELLAAAEERVVPTTSATERDLLKPAIEKLTLDECLAKLRVAWTQGTLVIGAAGGLDLGSGGEKQLEDAWKAGNEKEVAARAEEKTAPWGYPSDPAKAGKVASRDHQTEHDYDAVVFENGVRLFVKKTDFKKRQILVRALVGEGRLSLEKEKQALFWMTQQVFDACALGKHSADDLRRMMAGKEVGAQFGILDDSFAFTGATTAEDLQLDCELICAYLTDPGFREDGTTQLRRALPQMFESMKHQAGGPILQKFFPALYAGDPRVGIPRLEAIEAVTLDEMKGWITAAFDAAPIDLVVAGDVDLDKTIAACAQTFGALAKRRAPQDHADRRVFPSMKAGVSESYEIETQDPRTLVLMTFATADGREAAMRRNVRFLADVLADRLRVDIREKLGASYSPNAGADLSVTYPGFGRILVQAAADPAKAGELTEACLAVVDKLAKEGVTDEEVDRLRGETTNHLRDQMRENAFWIDVLGGFHGGRPVLDDLKTILTHYQRMKAADLTPLAKQFLGRDKASVATIKPAAVSK
jgi:zinc protease